MMLEKMSIQEVLKAVENPNESGLTFGDLQQILCVLEQCTNLMQSLDYKKLTFWEKIKSVFSKKPVYMQKEKGAE